MTSRWSGRSVDSLVAAFVERGKAYPSPMLPDDVPTYNRVVHEMAEIGDALKAAGPEGERALLALMDHAHLPIRQKAAAASLSFAKDRAVEVLIDITEMNAGEASMDAQMALMFAGEFDMEMGPIRRPNPIPSSWKWKGS
ncbi:MAG: DUF2019 domain-containing protein [Alphaproteobacteria bacterium]|nr:DUF2019 domain-containing protein [Alphaproteobacteria bacterium]